jgi:hypothetical protein
MKLYTEEQLRKAYNIGVNDGHNGAINSHISELLLTPIELPSDEEEEYNADSLHNKIKEIMNNDKTPVADRVTQCFKLYSNHYYPEILNQNKKYLTKTNNL